MCTTLPRFVPTPEVNVGGWAGELQAFPSLWTPGTECREQRREVRAHGEPREGSVTPTHKGATSQ